jgi:hypothetical protein
MQEAYLDGGHPSDHSCKLLKFSRDEDYIAAAHGVEE